ncbi:MAG: hypothetical protein PHR53_00890 [Bacteroidales bacterium]|nr:hypothetical protein [Bacteroidales bacterium]
MSNTIKRVDALREMELHETANGKLALFSISFYKQNGEIVSLPYARTAGLRANQKTNRMRGVQAVEKNGNAIGHIYPVSIDNIRTYNHQQVVL